MIQSRDTTYHNERRITERRQQNQMTNQNPFGVERTVQYLQHVQRCYELLLAIPSQWCYKESFKFENTDCSLSQELLCYSFHQLWHYLHDCSSPQLSGSYSLLAIKKCREANPDVIQTTQENYYVYEGIQTEEVQARLCQVKVKYFVTHCGMSSHSSVILIDGFPEYMSVGRDECNDFHVHRTFNRAGNRHSE